MDQIIVRGGATLRGEVTVSGSKNSTLALMAAALLPDDETVLHNVPRLRDVDMMLQILRALGARADWDGEHSIRIDASTVNNQEAPYDLVRQMRASFLVLGPLMARFGRARVSEPGGCAIGVRPIDQHLKGLEALGAKIQLDHGYVEAATPELRGGNICFDLTTVNGTQNVMMAATLAKGETRIENAAREPEVIELAAVLGAMGADITGAGTDQITIRGVGSLHGLDHAVAGDRIEAGTMLAAAMVTGGDVTVKGIDPTQIESTVRKLCEAGGEITMGQENQVHVKMEGPIRPVRAETAPYPGYPTDMQAQLMALLTVAEGTSVVAERVFENRFMHVPELIRMGADIALSGRSAHIRGVPELMGAEVMATDLRASAGLIVAGLAAKGDTVVNRVYHIDRGYERIEAKLRGLGADIRREN